MLLFLPWLWSLFSFFVSPSLSLLSVLMLLLFPASLSLSENSATPARLTNVESNFPSSDQQRADSLDLGCGNGRQ